MTSGLQRRFLVAMAVLSAILLAAPQLSASTIVFIGFDSHAALACPCNSGMFVPPADLVTGYYLPLGVDFGSPGAPIAILAGGNPVSAPNVAVGTLDGGIDYDADVFATFSFDVNFVSIALTSTSTSATLEAFGNNGALLNSASGGPGTIVVSDPGLIHSIEIVPDNAAFDNFAFGYSVPEPSTFLLLGSGLVAGVAFKRVIHCHRTTNGARGNANLRPNWSITSI
jgi:hypothetical protein